MQEVALLREGVVLKVLVAPLHQPQLPHRNRRDVVNSAKVAITLQNRNVMEHLIRERFAIQNLVDAFFLSD
jgi:hypothetical protein